MATWGEVVLTTLAREAMPLLRDRTGEVGRVVSRERCACGRTSLRLALGHAKRAAHFSLNI